jgi:hypothetical protein
MSLSSAIGVTSAVTFRSEAVTELGQAMHELIARQIDLGEFTDRFLAARIYTLCPVRPGLFVMSRPGGAAIVPVWSTIRALRQVMGNYDWFARTGQDLVDHCPPGVAVLIDAGMPHPIALPPSAVTSAKVHLA